MHLRTRFVLLLSAALSLALLAFGAVVYALVARTLPPDLPRATVLSTLLAALVGGGVLLVLALALAAWLLAGRTLAPGQAERARLADALSTQRRLVADAAHTLRTPLAAIRSNLELLGRGPGATPSEQRAALAAGKDEADRALRMLDTLFVLARADAGEQRLAQMPVALAPLAGEVVRTAHLRAPERSMAVNVAPELGALGDPDAIRQIISSLVENALAHTPPDAVIGVRGMRTGGRVALVVADTGPGIAPEQQSRVFERFARGEGASPGQGAGLGLAIASTLAEGMGGAITLTSAVGAGSVFTLSLPFAELPPEADA